MSSTQSIDEEDQSDEDDEQKQDAKKNATPIGGVQSIAMNDINYWKKKNKIDSKTKIFVIIGGYPDLRKALLDRGQKTKIDTLIFLLSNVFKVLIFNL